MFENYRPLFSKYLTAHGGTPPAGLTRGLFLLVGFILLAACNVQPTPTIASRSATPEFTQTSTSPATTPTISPTPTITPVPTSALGISEEQLAGVRLTFWHPWTGETGAAIQESLAEFNASNPYGISVEGISLESLNSLYDAIDSAELEVGLPNITVGANYRIQSWITAGKPVTSLNTYVNDPEWGYTQQEMQDFNPLFLQQDVKGNNRFGMPAVRSAPVMVYNSTWGEELGFSTPPVTPEDFKTQVCAAARSFQPADDIQVAGRGGWLIDTSPSAILSWFQAFESSILLPDDSGYRFNSPQSEQALLFLKELIDEGCAFEVLESPPQVEFANRRALVITSSLAELGYLRSEIERAQNNDRWTVTGFPSPEGSAHISVYGPSYLIFSGTPQENLASWLVIKWLLSPEQGARMVASRGTFPLGTAVVDLLEDYAQENPQWAAAQELLTNAQPEPGLESWSRVRWILGDVGTQVFRYYFTPDRIPVTLELMDETAAELHALSD